LKLLEESRRVVRVQNAAPDARRRRPRVFKHWHAAAPLGPIPLARCITGSQRLISVMLPSRLRIA
jgi:hypothetical protein